MLEQEALKQEKTKLELYICTAINEFNGNTGLKVNKVECSYLPQPTDLTIVKTCTITFE